MLLVYPAVPCEWWGRGGLAVDRGRWTVYRGKVLFLPEQMPPAVIF